MMLSGIPFPSIFSTELPSLRSQNGYLSSSQVCSYRENEGEWQDTKGLGSRHQHQFATHRTTQLQPYGQTDILD